MQIPETVQVLGKTYRVVIGQHDVQLWKHGQTAEVDNPAQEIRIRGDLSQEQREETFLHELMHCVEWAVIAERVSEAIIYGLSAGMYAVFKDNGWWPS